MTDRCYNRVECPSVFPADGDCSLFNHDLKVVGGCLAEGDPILSAILIQIGSDKLENQERGWWGDQFLGFPLGTRLWTLNGRALSENVRADIDEALREALDPLIEQGCVDDVTVRVVDTVNGPEARIQVFKDGRALLEFSL